MKSGYFCVHGLPHLSKRQKMKQLKKKQTNYIKKKPQNPVLMHTVLCYSPVLCALLHSLVTGLLCIVNINSMEKVKYLCSDCKI